MVSFSSILFTLVHLTVSLNVWTTRRCTHTPTCLLDSLTAGWQKRRRQHSYHPGMPTIPPDSVLEYQYDPTREVRKPCPTLRSLFNRVIFIPDVGFYSLPKIKGRTGRFIYDGLRLISFGLQVNTKKHKHCAKAQDCFGRNSRPPTASQWAAVRIKAYWVDRGNPQATPGLIPPCLLW